MKKLLSLFMATSLSFGTVCTNAFAAENEKSTQQAVLEKIKDRLGNTDRYENFNASYYGETGQKQYSFDWSTKDGKKSLSVTCTENGVITDYYSYDEDDDYEETSKKDLSAKAEKLAEGLNPDLDVTVKKNNLYKNGNYSIQRIENSVPVAGETGYISISGDGEKIKNYSLNYSGDYGFDSLTKTISKDEAKKAFADKIGLKLIYKKDYDTKEVYMAYVPKEENTYINALNGTAFKPEANRNTMFAGSSEASADMAKENDNGALSERELKEFEKINNLMGKDELFSKVKALSVLNISSKAVVSEFNMYYDEYTDRYCASMSFKDGDKEGNIYLNAKTGEILNFYRYSNAENKKLDENTAAAKAEAVLKALAPDKADEFKREGKIGGYYGTAVDYKRYVSGVECEFDGASIDLDGNGEVEGYNINYTDAKFPSKSSAMTQEKALENIFAKVPYEIKYIFDYSAKKYVAAYVFGSYDISLNAVTGELLNKNTASDEIDFSNYYIDIDESYAKTAIEKIADYGIYFEDKAFKPNENIKQKDFLAMLCRAFSYDSRAINDDTYDNAYDWAKRRGIITKAEENRDKQITRLDAAKYIVRAMGLEEAAKLDIYKAQFNDVKTDVGYSAILSGMGIMSGNGKGSFNPDGTLKRADSAVVIMKVIEK